ncbi:MAG: ABC transporter substrate-binding protein [Variovorax sp.]|nr:ABC transporter substrate-binding protein [Variovorax sp.]
MQAFLQVARRAFPALIAALAMTIAVFAHAEPARLKVMVAPTAFEAVYLARDQGIFARHNLDVEIVPGGPPDAMLPLLLNGQVQYAMSSGLAIVTAVSKGLPIRIALSNLNSGQPSTAALIAPSSSPVKTVADLKGRKVGLSSLRNQPHLGMLISARNSGIDPASISFVEIPTSAMVAAAEKGTVDAIYALDPHKSAALASGNFRLVEESVSQFMGGATAVTFAGSKEFLDRNPAIQKNFVAAMSEAFEFANSHPEAVRDVDVKYTKLPPEFIRGRQISPFSAVVDVAALKKMTDAMVANGWITRAPSAGELVDANAPTK